ncbi:hypothetical protein SUGI_0595230 [Cryptomeria japonica]|uniref:uncharacterized protein LOC131029836 isoform X2 n=1 Tax=Cryptomeria japonica TaxID=3369 RepID=UPI002414C92C|nr:uncharacterized protein LOC131029836 isoform X2 [Cryptomeria japonica]GLJ30098.1 hypothetical protein SUGI_0595230 [Cryptomeria japonica]
MRLFSCCSSLKCWDVRAERTESNKNTHKKPEKNTSSMEVEMDFSSRPDGGRDELNKNNPKKSEKKPQSSGKAKDGNSSGGRHCRRRSILEDDEEWEGLDELRTKVRRFMDEQEDSGTEEGNIMSYSASPLIIQAGGVASYHPLYSPSAPRPRFLRYGGSSPEFSNHKNRPGQSSVDRQRSEEESRAKAEAGAGAEAEAETVAEAEAEVKTEADQGYNGEKSEAIEEYVNESHGPQLTQDPPSSENQRSEITTENAEQPQGSAELDNTVEPNPRSVLAHSINTSTVGFKCSKPNIRRMMLPLFMFLVLATAASGFGLLDNNYLGTRNVQHCSGHMNPLPLTMGSVSLSQKMKEFFLLWKPTLYSEYMGRLKNSSSTFVGKLVDSYICSCASFSYLTSYKGWMTEENWAKFINFSRRLMGSFLSFCQDILISTRFDAGEIQRFCKCFKSNQTVGSMNISCPTDSGMNKTATVATDQASKDETNESIQGNSSTVQVCPIPEPTSFTIDAKHYVHPESCDQIVAEDEEGSTFCEKNASQGSHCSFPKVSKAKQVHFNPEPVVFPVREETFNTSSEGLTVNLGLDRKSSVIIWIRVAVVASIVAILLILVAAGNIYLGWLKVQEMGVTKHNSRNKPRQKRPQIEQNVTPPALGSFVLYVDPSYSREHTPTAVRRSARIRNKSLSPLAAQPIFTSPSPAHSFS